MKIIYFQGKIKDIYIAIQKKCKKGDNCKAAATEMIGANIGLVLIQSQTDVHRLP